MKVFFLSSFNPVTLDPSVSFCLSPQLRPPLAVDGQTDVVDLDLEFKPFVGV